MAEPYRRFPWIGALDARLARVGGAERGGLGARVFSFGEVRTHGAQARAVGLARNAARFREGGDGEVFFLPGMGRVCLVR